jgi:hypothetical protein
MKPKDLSPCLQKPISGPYSEADITTQKPTTLFT